MMSPVLHRPSRRATDSGTRVVTSRGAASFAPTLIDPPLSTPELILVGIRVLAVAAAAVVGYFAPSNTWDSRRFGRSVRVARWG
jgi:hypothetical protein